MYSTTANMLNFKMAQTLLLKKDFLFHFPIRKTRYERITVLLKTKKTRFWLNLMAKSILSHSDCHWFSCHLQLNTKSWVRSDQCFLSFTLKSTSNINSKRHVLVIPSPTKLRRDIVTLPSVHSSVTSLWTL